MSSTKVSHNQPNYFYAEIKRFVTSITNSSAFPKLTKSNQENQSSVINCISKAKAQCFVFPVRHIAAISCTYTVVILSNHELPI